MDDEGLTADEMAMSGMNASEWIAAGYAEEKGRADRETYTAEFGEAPEYGEVGDWDATAYAVALASWRRDDGDEDEGVIDAFRIAYFNALFDTPEAP
jgi:hypothetical protein